MSQSYNPSNAETLLVWALPRSFATTRRITIVFFSSGYLDVSVPQVSPTQAWYYAFSIVGCPIRKSSDRRLCAPPRSLSQLITSFIASASQGIRRAPLDTFLMIRNKNLLELYVFTLNMSKNFVSRCLDFRL